MTNVFFSVMQLVLGGLGVLLLLLIFIALVFIVVKKGSNRSKTSDKKLRITHLNEKFLERKNEILNATLDKKELTALQKQTSQEAKEKKKLNKTPTHRKIFVLDFDGDIAASRVDTLRVQVTALLGVAQPGDEVVVRLESPGGVVHGYGLAASQLARLRDNNIALTVCVDKIAASGGYMMACIANQIVCAPFAIVGSIGVVASIPNLNRLLKSKDIDYLELTAGEHKRTLSVFGEITEKGREKFTEQLEDTHTLFKQFVVAHRPQLQISEVATGEHWFGTRALEMKLVDKIQTSDDYLWLASKSADIYWIELDAKESMRERILGMFTQANSIFTRLAAKDMSNFLV